MPRSCTTGSIHRDSCGSRLPIKKAVSRQLLSGKASLLARALPVLFLVTTASLTLSVWGSSYAIELVAGAEGERVEIRLDLTPADRPHSLLVHVTKVGGMRAVSYNRYQLLVTDYRQGTLPRADLLHLTEKIKAVEVQGACRQERPGSPGLEPVDLFALSIYMPIGAIHCSGTLEESSEVLQDLVSTLAALASSVERRRLAEAYVIAREIAQERYSSLLQEGTVQFVAPGDLPTSQELKLMEAVGQTAEFHPLEKEDYSSLLEWNSQQRELFIATGGLGYQLTLFRSQ